MWRFIEDVNTRGRIFFLIDYFTVVNLVAQPLSCFDTNLFPFLVEIMLKNTSLHKDNMIYIIKLEGLYQNKVNSSVVSTFNNKIVYFPF